MVATVSAPRSAPRPLALSSHAVLALADLRTSVANAGISTEYDQPKIPTTAKQQQRDPHPAAACQT